MDSTVYIALSRQSGLKTEMSVIANNLANLSTTGYRAEGLLFSEFIQGVDAPHPSLSMTDAGIHRTDFTQAPFRQTGGTFDLAIEGTGFFQIETPEGNRLRFDSPELLD